jgi:hypothetical protein
MCTTSTECKIVITVVLTVMSVMDPHMISWNLRWVWLVLSKCKIVTTSTECKIVITVATISLLKLASIVALGRTKCGSPTKSTSRS